MINFEFLEEARILALDGTLSPKNQSLILEVVFWAVAYTLFGQIFSRLVRRVYRASKIWKHARERIGVFCGNGRDDAVLLSCWGAHHGFAAYLMYRGMIDDKPMTWRHGYLVETGFEVADFVAMIFQFYPYAKHDGMKDEIKAALIMHHIPGIVLSGFVMETGLYENEHMQKIVLSLLAGAFVSCSCAVFLYQLDFRKQMTKAAVGFNVNVAFFMYCRWYVYPIESLALIQDVRADPELSGSIVIKLLYGAGVLMSLFNLGVVIDLVPKTIRYVKRAFDGVTEIDTEPVPSSRDSMLGVVPPRRSRRASSFMMAIDAVNPTAPTATRSSLITVMGLNAMDDLVQTEKRASSSTYASSTVIPEEEDDGDLSKEELDHLQKMAGSMLSGAKKKAQ